MRIIQWQSSFEVGQETIDTQHRKLVNMIADLQRSLEEGRSQDAVSETLKELVDYTQYHFREEEKVMHQCGHQGIDYHKYLHRQLIEQVINILADIKNGKQYSAEDLIKYLIKWLTEHIVGEDSKIGLTIKSSKGKKAHAKV